MSQSDRINPEEIELDPIYEYHRDVLRVPIRQGRLILDRAHPIVDPALGTHLRDHPLGVLAQVTIRTPDDFHPRFFTCHLDILPSQQALVRTLPA